MLITLDHRKVCGSSPGSNDIRFDIQLHSRLDIDLTTSRRHHVSTLSRNLHREAAMAEEDDDAAVQLVLQRRRLQEARLEVRTPTCHARSQFDRVN